MRANRAPPCGCFACPFPADYQTAGVKLIWVINPKARVMRAYRSDHTISELAEADQVTGETILPGFSVPLRDLLPAVEPAKS